MKGFQQKGHNACIFAMSRSCGIELKTCDRSMVVGPTDMFLSSDGFQFSINLCRDNQKRL